MVDGGYICVCNASELTGSVRVSWRKVKSLRPFECNWFNCNGLRSTAVCLAYRVWEESWRTRQLACHAGPPSRLAHVPSRKTLLQSTKAVVTNASGFDTIARPDQQTRYPCTVQPCCQARQGACCWLAAAALLVCKCAPSKRGGSTTRGSKRPLPAGIQAHSTTC